MADVVVEQAVRLLVTSSSLRLINGRAYKGPLQSIPNPVYPCIVLQRPAPGIADRNASYGTWPLFVTHYSKLSYDQTWALYELSNALLQDWALTIAGRGFCLRRQGEPIEAFDDDGGEAYYMSTVTYWVRQIG